MSNRFFITVLVVIALFVGAFALTRNKNDAGPSSNTQPTNHIKGQGKSGVVLIEYGDLQCPACWQFEPIIKKVIEKYEDQITFQFRNFPLSQIHPNAFVAHRAVEAADKQGKFWEMHDMLFEHAHQFDSTGRVIDIEWTATRSPMPFFESYAKQLNLDVAKFKQDMDSAETNNLINADVAEAQKVGADSTPTFVLDGKKLEPNPSNLDEFSKVIDEAIQKKTTRQ